MPSPWQDYLASSPDKEDRLPCKTAEDEAVSKALERLTLASDRGVLRLCPEVDEDGQIEYKLRLPAEPNKERLCKLVTQMKFRLINGGGEAIYELGVLDDGTAVGLSKEEMASSFKTLEVMAEQLDANLAILREITMPAEPPSIKDLPFLGSVTVPIPPAHKVTSSILAANEGSHPVAVFTRKGSKLPPDLIKSLTGKGPRSCLEVKVSRNDQTEEDTFLNFEDF